MKYGSSTIYSDKGNIDINLSEEVVFDLAKKMVGKIPQGYLGIQRVAKNLIASDIKEEFLRMKKIDLVLTF